MSDSSFAARVRRAIALTAAIACGALFAPAAAPAQTAPVVAPLKIGLIMSFSGPGALLGRSVIAAVAAWFAMHGGDRLGGRPAIVIRRDDGHSPETARRLAQELIVGDKVDLLLGGSSTPEAVAIGTVSTQAKIPYFIINATSPGILANAPYSMRTSYLTTDLGPPVARWAVKNGLKNIYAVVADYSSGADTLKALTDALGPAGGKIVGSVAVPLDTTDFSAYFLRVKDAKPDAMFAFVGGGPSSINTVKQFGTSGLKASGIKLLGTADLISEELMSAEGEDALGVVTASNYTPSHNSKLNRDFVAAYRAALPNVTPDDLPSFIPVQAFDALTAFDYAVSAQKGNIDPERTIALLLGKTIESPRGPITFDPQTREVRENLYIRRVERNGDHYVNTEIASFPPAR